LNVHGINGAGQKEMCTAEPLLPVFRCFEVEFANEKLKRYKSPGADQILAELIQTGGIKHYVLKSTDLLILFGIRKNCHSSGRNLLLYLFIDDETGCSNCRGILLLPTTYKISSSIHVSRLTSCIGETVADHWCRFQQNRLVTDQIFCIYQISGEKIGV
jgi:hypothetical protein